MFWRCFAATFARRRAAVLEDLRATLAANGIEPLPGIHSASLSVHTQRRRANPLMEARTMVVQAAAIQWGVPVSDRKAPPDHRATRTGIPRAEPGFEPNSQ